MLLPALKSRGRTRTLVTSFGGYHHGPGCRDGEFYEETNLSAQDWPALSPRRPRRRLAVLEKPHGLFAKNGLLWADGSALCYLPGGSGAEEELVRLEGALSDTDKTFCGMGTKVLIFPDKVSFDTVSRTVEPLESHWATPSAGIAGLDGVSFQACDAEGTTYQPDGCGTVEPENVGDGYVFLKQKAGSSSATASSSTLLVYNASAAQWVTAELGYCRIESEGLGAAFQQWDTVTLSGVSQTILGRMSRDLDGDKIVYAKDEDWIVVSAAPESRTRDYYGIFRQTRSEVRWNNGLTGAYGGSWLSNNDGGEITVARRVPDLDYVTECGNRVWGCSSAENVVYACKLGDPTNWFSYRGTAADSYAATVGSDGPFTGAASCLGYVLFFKENTLHKLYGAKPADYQLTAISCRGVQPGSAKSLCVLNETLYYKADDGIMVYDGSLPVQIGAPLGEVRYSGAVGGGALKGYYVSMADEAGGYHLFCYDEARGLWHREDAVQALDFARVGADLFFVAADGGLWAVDGSTSYRAGTGTAEPAVAWSAETGDLGLAKQDYKYLARLALRMEAQAGASVKIEVQYDSGVWETVCERSFSGRTPLLLPFVPRRFDHLRLRISGTGRVRLYALERVTEGGSALNMPE